MKTKQASFYDPPGGMLIWILIILEVLTFSIALIVLAFKAHHDPQLFHQSRKLLHTEYGALNTIFLLTSGYFMARAIYKLKNGWYEESSRNVLIAIGGGLSFLILKSVEYYEKLDQGLGIGYNDFFQYYWMLTLFHVIHVLVGLGIIVVLYFNIRKKKNEISMEDAEAGAAFWHMCDLIWLLIFPALYLLF